MGIEPADWIRRLILPTHIRWSWSVAVRSVLVVGAPFFLGLLLGNVLDLMWASLAGLFFIASEKPNLTTIRLIRFVAFVIPFSSCAFLLGYLRDSSVVIQIGVMAVIAFAGGAFASRGFFFACASMQVLLIASLVLGMKSEPWWRAGLFFLAGAAFYFLLTLIDLLLRERRVEGQMLSVPIRVLAKNCATRADALRAGRAEVADNLVEATEKGDQKYFNFVKAMVGAAVPEAMTVEYRAVFAATDRLEQKAWELTDEAQLREIAAICDRCAEMVQGHNGAGRESVSDPEAAGRSNLREATDLIGAVERFCGEAILTFPKTDRLASQRTKLSVSYLLTNGMRIGLPYTVAISLGCILPFNHWFWAATTVALIMTPSMGNVVARALQRVLGSIVGVLVGSGILWVSNNHYWVATTITICAFFLPWACQSSQIFKQFFMTPIILLLSDLIADPSVAVFYGTERIAATVLGALLVIGLGYLIWPGARRPDFSSAFTTLRQDLAQWQEETQEQQAGAAKNGGTVAELRDKTLVDLSIFDRNVEIGLSEPPPTSAICRGWLPAVLAAARACECLDERNDCAEALRCLDVTVQRKRPQAN